MKPKKVVSPRNREESERKLLEAAKEVFSENGYEGATTRMIAQRSGVNLGLIQRYFGNKYGLLVAIMDKGMKETSELPLPYPRKDTLTEECLAYVEFKFNTHVDHIDFIKIVILQSLIDAKFAKAIQNRDFMQTQVKIRERITTHFKDIESKESKNEIQFIADYLDDTVFQGLFMNHLLEGIKKEDCLKRVKEYVSRMTFKVR